MMQLIMVVFLSKTQLRPMKDFTYLFVRKTVLIPFKKTLKATSGVTCVEAGCVTKSLEFNGGLDSVTQATLGVVNLVFFFTVSNPLQLAAYSRYVLNFIRSC